MRQRSILAAALACGLAADLAAAGSTPGPAAPGVEVPAVVDLSPATRQWFDTADADRSAGLTRGEAAKAGFEAKEKFDAVDEDRDGVVTVFEIGKYVAKRAQSWRDADTDRDGHVSRDEARQAPSLWSVFNRADRNSDGIIRQQEYEVFWETSLYQDVEIPSVVPNLINEKF